VPATLKGRRHGSAQASDSISKSLSAKVNEGNCAAQRESGEGGEHIRTVNGGSSACR
jgi:hypothetical protein